MSIKFLPSKLATALLGFIALCFYVTADVYVYAQTNPTGPITLSGSVFNDVNGNGIKDTNEPGMQGCVVYCDLYNTGQFTPIDNNKTTDSNGNFKFVSLRARTYTIRIIPPAGYTTTVPAGGSFQVTLTPGVPTVISFGEHVIAPVPPTFVGVIGSNMTGVNTADGDPIQHPFLVQTVQQDNLKVLRVWLDGNFNTQYPAAYFQHTLAWSKYVKITAVANFQNSVPRCSAPSDTQWVNYWNNFPAPSVTGIWAISLGNEVDTKAYYSGSVAQLGHLMELAYPILHEKGYYVIAGSVLNSLNYLTYLNTMDDLQYCDAIDRHFYSGSINQVLATVDQSILFGHTYNKDVVDTEGSLREYNSPAGRTTWANDTKILIQDLRTRNGTFLLFPLYVLSTDPVDVAAPVTSQYLTNEPFWSAFQSAAGN